MRLAGAVQRAIGRRQPGVNPCLVAVPPAARGRAGLQHLGKGGVAGDLVIAPPQTLGQRVRTMKAIERQNRAAFGLHPEHLGVIAAIAHGENAVAIGQHHHVGRNDLRAKGRVHARPIPRGQGGWEAGRARNHQLAPCHPPRQALEAPHLQERSSVGRASVSKTEGRGFESPRSCQVSPFMKFLP